ncbi:peptidoglycan-binding protein [Lacrimispora indolis]|uniref:peptidoglycan-binding protein n=1 Tax=Lacrimispora indolis TaxID=69825 RepID=UPI00045E71C8|nr:peptidoglycan-binding protein [Lacrimispora indolis]
MLLKGGDKGIQVKYLQQALKIMCCNPGSIDSDYGPGTQAAVEKFQQEWGLGVDGIVGDKTWNCLVDEIKPIQQALKDKGFYKEAITGIAKETTYGAVISFQESRGLTADGMVGNSTRARLFNDENGGDDLMLPLSTGDKGDYVLYLQHGLRIMCCSPGSIDGVYGSGTAAAVSNFQSKYGIAQTGTCDTTTWNKLKQLIIEIQKRLQNRGYNVPLIDGIATSALAEAIKQFQEANYLTADGQVGPSTYDILMSDIPDGATDALPLKLKSRGPRVLYFQYALRINCINPNGTDGVFGAGTEAGVKRYQTKAGITSDGIVGTATWEQMRKDITPIQTALGNKGYDVGFVDGIATDKVYNAVLKYQTENGLTADGMVGTATKAMLLGGTSGSGTISSTLKAGSNGSLTLYLQRLLNELGFQVALNGIFDNQTRDAAIAFQNANGLVADGVVGGGTWKKLFEMYHVNVSGKGVEKLIHVAKHELEWEFKEDNANNITPYGQWYGMNGSAWCAMFVSYCAYQAGVIGDLVPNYAWCPSGMTWYKERNRYYKRNSGYIPKRGDIIFFYNNELGRVAHTGIVIEGDDKYITTIEGNTSLDRVQKCTYNRNHSTIDGYGSNGGEAIEVPKPPTEKEIESVLLDYYREFLKVCYVVLPSDKIKLNQAVEIPVPPDSKIIVEASAESTLFDNSANNSGSIVCDISNGRAMSGQIDLKDKISISLEGFEEAQSILDIVFDINSSVEVGASVLESGLRSDTTGNWVYIAYTIKKEVQVKDGFPPIEFAFKYTYCVKIENGGGTSVFEPVFAFVEKYKWEIAKVGAGILVVIAVVIAVKAGVIAAGAGGLATLIANILSKLAQVVFA